MAQPIAKPKGVKIIDTFDFEQVGKDDTAKFNPNDSSLALHGQHYLVEAL